VRSLDVERDTRGRSKGNGNGFCNGSTTFSIVQNERRIIDKKVLDLDLGNSRPQRGIEVERRMAEENEERRRRTFAA
jgi:hypothetical protein